MVLEPRRQTQLVVRHDSLMQEHQRRRQANRLAPMLERQRFNSGIPLNRQCGGAGIDGNTAALERRQEFQTLGKIPPAQERAKRMGKRARIPLHGRRVDNGADLGPSPKIVPSEKEENRTAYGEHARTGRQTRKGEEEGTTGAERVNTVVE